MIDWKEVSAILISATIAGGLVIGYIRMVLAGSFASSGDITKLDDRVKTVETRLGTMPSHDDMRMISVRVAAVEQAVAVGNADIRAVAAGVIRLEHQMDLLMQHHLPKGGDK